MQWMDVDRPTFTRICKSAINWLDYGNSFSGIQTNCLMLMTDYLHPGKTTTGQYYAEPAFKLLDVIKKKQWQKLSLRSSFTFSWQCTSAQVIGSSASSLRLWICSTEPSCLQSRLGSRWLFRSKKSEVPSSWNMIYRWWITEDRCEGMVWESKQKILFSGHKQLRTTVENMHWCCMRICQRNDCMCDIIC